MTTPGLDVTKLTIAELKALAYDQIAIKEVTDNNLRIINAEIDKKFKEINRPIEVVGEEVTEKLEDNK